MTDLDPNALDRIAELTAKLTNTEQHLTAFFDLAVDMFSIADAETGKLVMVNQRWELCSGWTAEELTSKPFIEFVHPDDREKTKLHFAEMISEGVESADFQNRYAKKEGGWLLLSWRSTQPIDGKIYSVARAIEKQPEYLRRYEAIRLHRHAIGSIIEELGQALESLSLSHDRLDDIRIQMKADG